MQADLLELRLEHRAGFLAEARVVLVRERGARHDPRGREELLRLLDVRVVLEDVGVVGEEQVGEDAVRANERALHDRVQEVVVREQVVHRLARFGRLQGAVLAEDDVGHVEVLEVADPEALAAEGLRVVGGPVDRGIDLALLEELTAGRRLRDLANDDLLEVLALPTERAVMRGQRLGLSRT